MVVVQSLRQVPSLLREQPILFVPLLVFELLYVPQLLTFWIDPLDAAVFSLVLIGVYLFAVPFFLGGLLGMANDIAIHRPTSLRKFFTHGREHYSSLLVANLLLFAIYTVLSVVTTVAVVGGMFAYFATGERLAGLAIAGGIGLVVALVYLTIFVLLQFFAHAIVIEERDAIAGVKRSVSVVKANLRPVGGYFAIYVAGVIVVWVVFRQSILWAFPVGEPGEPAPLPELGPALIGASGWILFVTGIGALYFVYSVVFYRAISDQPASEPEQSADFG